MRVSTDNESVLTVNQAMGSWNVFHDPKIYQPSFGIQTNYVCPKYLSFLELFQVLNASEALLRLNLIC